MLLVAVLFAPELNAHPALVLPRRRLGPAVGAREARAGAVPRLPDRAQARSRSTRASCCCRRRSSTGLLAGLILLEPDLGTAVLLAATALTMLFLAGLSWRFVGAAGALALPLALRSLVISVPYRRGAALRLPRPRERPARQRLPGAAVADRGRLGRRPRARAGRQRAEALLPAPPAVGLHLRDRRRGARHDRRAGGRGALRRARLARRCAPAGARPTRSAATSAGASPSLLVMQALINICVAIALLPTKGIPLPFISYGGSSMVVVARRLRRAAQRLAAWMTMRDATHLARSRRAPRALLAGGGIGRPRLPGARGGRRARAPGVARELRRHAGRARGAPGARRAASSFVPLAGAAVGRARAGRAAPRRWRRSPARPFAARRLMRERGIDARASAPAATSRRRRCSARAWRGGPCCWSSPTPRAGVANRWLSRFADGAAVGYETAARELALSEPASPACRCAPSSSRCRRAARRRAAAPAGARRQPGRAAAQPAPAGGGRARRSRAGPGSTVAPPVRRAPPRRGARRLRARAGSSAPRVEVVPFLDDVAGGDGGGRPRRLARRRDHARRDLRRRPARRCSCRSPSPAATRRDNARRARSRGRGGALLDDAEARPRSRWPSGSPSCSPIAAALAERGRRGPRPGAARRRGGDRRRPWSSAPRSRRKAREGRR